MFLDIFSLWICWNPWCRIGGRPITNLKRLTETIKDELEILLSFVFIAQLLHFNLNFQNGYESILLLHVMLLDIFSLSNLVSFTWNDFWINCRIYNSGHDLRYDEFESVWDCLKNCYSALKEHIDQQFGRHVNYAYKPYFNFARHVN